MMRNAKSMTKKEIENLKRNPDFLSEPESGWVHEKQHLDHGDGIFYKFSVRYVGAVVMPQSLRTLDHDNQVDATRESIALAVEAAQLRKKQKRKTSKQVKAFLGKTPNIKLAIKPVSLGISTDGIVISLGDKNVLAFHKMPTISFAAGGEGWDYDCVCYVAKNHRNVRECHVFDCSPQSDDVLATIGQAFVLAKENAMKGISSEDKKKSHVRNPKSKLPGAPRGGGGGGDYASVGDPVYDTAADGGYMGVGGQGQSDGGYMDVGQQGGSGDGGYMDVGKQGGSGDGGYMDVGQQNSDGGYMSVGQGGSGDGGYMAVGQGGSGDGGYMAVGQDGSGDGGYMAVGQGGGDGGYMDVGQEEDIYDNVTVAGKQFKSGDDYAEFLNNEPTYDNAAGGGDHDAEDPTYDNAAGGDQGWEYIDSEALEAQDNLESIYDNA